MSFVYVSDQHVQKIKQKINEKKHRSIGEQLANKADKAMEKGPWSVTYSEKIAPSNDPHDYFSEGPYWWPDPKDPKGPYIRKDGQINPDQQKQHRKDLGALANTVLDLTNAGYYLDNQKYQKKAMELLRIWFVDTSTKMNPHLEYGQGIKGICDGRGIGIIELQTTHKIVHALGFLEKTLDHQKEIDQIKAWFAEMLTWITTSEKGIDESLIGNNHSSWWAAHVGAYASLLNKQTHIEKAVTFFKDQVMATQMAQDGSFPEELARTRSLFYSLYNLNAYALICEVAQQKQMDLWHFQSKKNQSMKKAIEYTAVAIDNPYQWSHPQITGDVLDEQYAIQVAAHRLKNKDWQQINQKWAKDKYPIRDQNPLGPLVLLPGSCMLD